MTARVHSVDDDEVQGLLVDATTYRAHLADDRFGLMDSVDGTLGWAAEAFVDPERIERVDPDSISAQALSIIYAIEVAEGSREDVVTAELVGHSCPSVRQRHHRCGFGERVVGRRGT